MILKPPLTLDEQVQSLIAKGFVVGDTYKTREALSRIGYYRLHAYLRQFRHDDSYTPNIPIEQVLKIYEFDCELRTWLYPIIGNIECYTRAQISNYLALNYGSECYLQADTFDPKRHNHDRYLSRINAIKRDNAKSAAIHHHINHYNGRFPIWVLFEFFSTGLLSITYADLKRKDRKYIASNAFHTGDLQLVSWLRAFTELRNKCAHYTRLYMWRFPTVPKQPKVQAWKMNNTLFSQILMLGYLNANQDDWIQATENLAELIARFDTAISFKSIGFPKHWKEILTTCVPSR